MARMAARANVPTSIIRECLCVRGDGPTSQPDHFFSTCTHCSATASPLTARLPYTPATMVPGRLVVESCRPDFSVPASAIRSLASSESCRQQTGHGLTVGQTTLSGVFATLRGDYHDHETKQSAIE
jgi:hypothetical protein